MDPYLYRLTRFVILLSCLIPSFICYLLVFFFLFKMKQITTQHLHHHFIFALLVCNFILITTELPITLVFSYHGEAPVQSDRFCSFWMAYNYGLYDIGLFLMAFGSIERYFLIFHEGSVRRWRHIVHYPLLLFCFIYPSTFYSMIVNMYPCESIYYYDTYTCGSACYSYLPASGTADYMAQIFTPAVLIILANLILLFRVVKQKRSMKIANTWRKNRLMYIQLVSISILYFLIWIPFVAISMIRLFYDPIFLQDLLMLVMNYCLYICPLASPFISLIGLPVVRQHLTESILHMIRINAIGNNNRVVPTVSGTTRNRNQQMLNGIRYDEHQ